MYVFRSDRTGKLSLIQTVHDLSMPNKEDVKKWLTKRQIKSFPADGLPPLSSFLLDAESLCEYCKVYGVMLHVDEESREIGTAGEQECGNVRWVHLLRTRASKGAGNVVPEYRPSDLWVPSTIKATLDAQLADETSEARRLSSWPIERTFVYLDVSDFSKYPPVQETLIINSLIRIVNDVNLWKCPGKPIFRQHEAMLCIGDGYIFAFAEPVLATFFAAYLAEVIEQMVAIRRLPVDYHFRMGIHVGPVFFFWDPGRDGWNYIGDGINGGQRVLSAVGKDMDDVIFISDQVVRKLRSSEDESEPFRLMLSSLQNRGRRFDKHGNPWRVYELNHSHLCGPLIREVFRSLI